MYARCFAIFSALFHTIEFIYFTTFYFIVLNLNAFGKRKIPHTLGFFGALLCRALSAETGVYSF